MSAWGKTWGNNISGGFSRRRGNQPEGEHFLSATGMPFGVI
jgi:hypothetical protein